MDTVLVPTSTCPIDSSRVSTPWALWVLQMRDTKRELPLRCLSGSAAANPTLDEVSPYLTCYMLPKRGCMAPLPVEGT